MKKFNLNVSTRNAQGRGPSKRLRAAGQIPAVIYGKNAPESLSVNEKDWGTLWKKISNITALIEVKQDGQKDRLCLVQDTQRHPLRDNFLAIDFKEVLANEKMTASVSLRIVGEAYGVKNEGAILQIAAHEVDVECFPKDLPEYLEVDVTALKGDEAFFVKNLKIPTGVAIKADPELPLVVCSIPEEEVVAEPVAAVATDAAAAPAADGKPADPKAKGAAPAVDPKAKGAAPAAAAAPDAKAKAPTKK